jgi:hypothetical protein
LGNTERGATCLFNKAIDFCPLMQALKTKLLLFFYLSGFMIRIKNLSAPEVKKLLFALDG